MCPPPHLPPTPPPWPWGRKRTRKTRQHRSWQTRDPCPMTTKYVIWNVSAMWYTPNLALSSIHTQRRCCLFESEADAWEIHITYYVLHVLAPRARRKCECSTALLHIAQCSRTCRNSQKSVRSPIHREVSQAADVWEFPPWGSLGGLLCRGCPSLLTPRPAGWSTWEVFVQASAIRVSVSYSCKCQVFVWVSAICFKFQLFVQVSAIRIDFSYSCGFQVSV
jgi:hypothetical protein